MADHILQQIRAAAAALLAGLDLGDQPVGVYKGRRSAFQEHELPAINIRSIAEDAEVQDLGPNPALLRNGTLSIDLVAIAVDDVEPTLFAMQAEVERRFAADARFGGLLHGIWLTTSNQVEIEGDDVDYTTERRTLTFQFTALTRLRTPELAA